MVTKRTEKIEGFFWLGIGIIICIWARKAHLGSLREPGPGFVAFASGLFVSIVGLIMVISQTLSKIAYSDGLDFSSVFRNISWSKLGYTMGLLFAYALFLNFLGYIVTTFFLMWGLFYGREKSRWASSILISLVTVGSSYLVFEVWLFCQLPRGIFPWW